jgi:hypothetical protein
MKRSIYTLLATASTVLALITLTSAARAQVSREDAVNAATTELRNREVEFDQKKNNYAILEERYKAGQTAAAEVNSAKAELEVATNNLTRARQILDREQRVATFYRPMTIVMKDATVQEAAKALSQASGMTINVDKQVPKDIRLSVEARGVPFATVLESIAEQAKLMIAPDGSGVILKAWPTLKLDGNVKEFTGPNAPWSTEWGSLVPFVNNDATAKWMYLSNIIGGQNGGLGGGGFGGGGLGGFGGGGGGLSGGGFGGNGGSLGTGGGGLGGGQGAAGNTALGFGRGGNGLGGGLSAGRGANLTSKGVGGGRSTGAQGLSAAKGAGGRGDNRALGVQGGLGGGFGSAAAGSSGGGFGAGNGGGRGFGGMTGVQSGGLGGSGGSGFGFNGGGGLGIAPAPLSVSTMGDHMVVVAEPGPGPKGEAGAWLTVYKWDGARLSKLSTTFHRSALDGGQGQAGGRGGGGRR